MSRSLSSIALAFAIGCAPAPSSAPPASPPSASPPSAVASARSAVSAEKRPFRCTEVIGLTITAEWYGAGFEQLVDDARFQARTRPHTFVDQWADPSHEAWSASITSACTEDSTSPDRVVLFAANWKLTSEQEWFDVLARFVATAKQRYPQLREIELYTVLRGPQNQSCGDPKSVVEPMIDSALARVAASEPSLVHAGPRLEAADCAIFDKGGPHFTEEGRKIAAKQLAEVLR